MFESEMFPFCFLLPPLFFFLFLFFFYALTFPWTRSRSLVEKYNDASNEYSDDDDDDRKTEKGGIQGRGKKVKKRSTRTNVV